LSLKVQSSEVPAYDPVPPGEGEAGDERWEGTGFGLWRAAAIPHDLVRGRRRAKLAPCPGESRPLCENDLQGRCEVQIVDVLKNFAAAMEHQVLLTLCLLWVEPPPGAMIIGNLSNLKRVRSALHLDQRRPTWAMRSWNYVNGCVAQRKCSTH